MLGSGAPFLALCQKRRHFRPQFWKNNFGEHLWSQGQYSRDYFKPHFRSLGLLVSILRAIDWWPAGFRSPFFALCQKGDPLDPNFGKIISGNIFDHQKDTLGIIFKPNFRSLGPLVPLSHVFDWRYALYLWRLFWSFVKNGGLLEPNFGKRISGNIFDHRKDTLGIILSPNSGL